MSIALLCLQGQGAF